MLGMAEHLDVAILGAGFSGTMLAAHLLRSATRPLRLLLLDRRPQPGRGIAYSTECEHHVLNVPAGKMSAFPDKPDHFLRWLEARQIAAAAGDFMPRMLYGEYVAHNLREALGAVVPGTHFEFLNDEAVALEDDQPALLHLRSGRVLRAKQAVLALGNFPPADPRIEDDSFFRSERYIAHAWSNNAVSRIGNTDPLIMIGSGLTMLDLAVELDARGHRAPIQCLSRHGLKPQRHRPYEPWPPFLKAGDATSARDLLHRVRVEAALAMSQGKDWRAVIDSLRAQTPGIWKSLPLYEKRRFLRHVRPFWEVHRHRVAPHVADVIDRRMGAGLLEIFGGRLRALRETPTGAEAVYMPRRESKLRSLQGAFVVNCTGPEGDFRKLRHPLVDSLLEHGLARPDRLGMGLDVAADGALMDAWGEASSWLFTLGPLRKGALWETTAVPEIRVQAAELARRLLSS